MSLHRYAAKRDTAEPEIVTALEQCGWHVHRLNSPGVPDLLLSRGQAWHLAEIKTGKKQLTPAQITFHKLARAHIPILRTVEDAVEWSRKV